MTLLQVLRSIRARQMQLRGRQIQLHGRQLSLLPVSSRFRNRSAPVPPMGRYIDELIFAIVAALITLPLVGIAMLIRGRGIVKVLGIYTLLAAAALITAVILFVRNAKR